MLKRFDDEDFQDEYFEDQNEGETEFIHYAGKDDLIESMQDMEMFDMDYNAKILEMAIDIAKDSWTWKFKSSKNKMKIIKELYISMNELLEIEEIEEIEKKKDE